MLDAQGMRAGRLIVDTGIHALGWDRSERLTQMIARRPELDATIERTGTSRCPVRPWPT